MLIINNTYFQRCDCSMQQCAKKRHSWLRPGLRWRFSYFEDFFVDIALHENFFLIWIRFVRFLCVHSFIHVIYWCWSGSAKRGCLQENCAGRLQVNEFLFNSSALARNKYSSFHHLFLYFSMPGTKYYFTRITIFLSIYSSLARNKYSSIHQLFFGCFQWNLISLTSM